jgi:methionyl-tRNA formyltransferase
MKVAVLTTETTHHAYFVRELARAADVEQVIVERRSAAAPFPTHHPFENERDAHESRTWFDGERAAIRDIAPTLEVDGVNAPEAVAALDGLRPQVVFVFGTGRLLPEVIRACPNGLVNLHGGDPEEYRGLDSHLWAIYHRDFSGLVTTLHRVNEELDDGEIVLQAAIPLRREMPLCELRQRNTEVCVNLAVLALDMHARHGEFLSRPQGRRGRYYSFMPAVLKEVCRERFESYTSRLE